MQSLKNTVPFVTLLVSLSSRYFAMAWRSHGVNNDDLINNLKSMIENMSFCIQWYSK